MPRLFDPAQGGPEIKHPTPGDARRRKKRLRNRITVGEVVDRYLRHKQAVNGFEPRTFAQVESMLAKFVKACGHRILGDLMPCHVSDFIEANPKWKKNGTRLRVADAINSVFNWCVERGELRRNPVKSVSNLYPASDPREPMDDVTFERLCEAAPKPLERIIRYIRYVGCRPGEALKAKWEDIDLDKCVWTVKKHKTVKKTRKPKCKEISPLALKVLQQIGPKPFGFVFASRLGRPWVDTGSLDRAVKNLFATLPDLPTGLTLHCLRHRFITCAAAAGAAVPAIAAQVGHDDLASTWRYIHMTTERESVRRATQLGQPNA